MSPDGARMSYIASRRIRKKGFITIVDCSRRIFDSMLLKQAPFRGDPGRCFCLLFAPAPLRALPCVLRNPGVNGFLFPRGCVAHRGINFAKREISGAKRLGSRWLTARTHHFPKSPDTLPYPSSTLLSYQRDERVFSFTPDNNSKPIYSHP